MFRVIGRLAQCASRSGARRFGGDESGAVAIIFALTMVVVLSLVGGAIDYGRAVHARYQIQEAVDSAVLAAARVWQTENDINLAQEKGLVHYNNNKPLTFSSQVSKFTPDFTANTISMEAEGVVPTPFLSLVRHEGYTVGAFAQARLDVGQNAGQSVEVSLMLDVTGSMCDPCTKIEDLKLAAKDFIDIVVWQDQSEYTSKVAVVPFANAVNVGTSALANSVRGNLRTGSCLTSSSPCISILTDLLAGLLPWVFGTPPNWYRFPKPSSGTNTFKVSDRCVTERTGPAAYNDDAPNTASKKVGPGYFTNTNYTTSNPNGSCGGLAISTDAEKNTIQPLSNDKTMLKRRIDKLATGGGTAGHLGTAWAWYMLSPNWAYLWPTANQPKPYGAEKLQKYAILMTDGDYNTMYCNGAEAKNSASGDINCNATNGQSYNQARTLCTNMKAKGITVYTVGFQIGGSGSTAYQTLQQCASSPDKFFNAEDGTELRLSFRAIALEVAKLSLSQ
jgi:Flp pilus assembly protein TadG